MPFPPERFDDDDGNDTNAVGRPLTLVFLRFFVFYFVSVRRDRRADPFRSSNDSGLSLEEFRICVEKTRIFIRTLPIPLKFDLPQQKNPRDGSVKIFPLVFLSFEMRAPTPSTNEPKK